MKFEIIREIYYPFGDHSEEQWSGPIEFGNITETINYLKSTKGIIHNKYSFNDIDLDNNTVEFTITNRNRYNGDNFTIRPIKSIS